MLFEDFNSTLKIAGKNFFKQRVTEYVSVIVKSKQRKGASKIVLDESSDKEYGWAII